MRFLILLCCIISFILLSTGSIITLILVGSAIDSWISTCLSFPITTVDVIAIIMILLIIAIIAVITIIMIISLPFLLSMLPLMQVSILLILLRCLLLRVIGWVAHYCVLLFFVNLLISINMTWSIYLLIYFFYLSFCFLFLVWIVIYVSALVSLS